MKKFENIGNKLENINKDIPFRVPEDYFNTFPSKLAGTIKEHGHIPASKKFLNTWKPYAAAAILIVALIVTGTITSRNRTHRAEQRFYSEISGLVEDELYSINEQTILEVTAMEEQRTEPSGNTDEVLHYLLNGDIENELMDAL